MPTATLQWTQDEAFSATLPSGQTLTLDGATQSGPSPAEVLLPALGACAGIDIVMILKKKRQNLEALEVTVEGARRDTHPRIWQNLKVHFTVTGPVEEKAMEHALELASTKYCTVAAILDKSASIEWSYTIGQQ